MRRQRSTGGRSTYQNAWWRTEATIRRLLERYFELVGADVERAEELYHEDAVLSFRRAGSGSRAGQPSPSGAASTP